MQESLIGKVQVIELLEDNLDKPLTFKTFQQVQNGLLREREQINWKIAEVQKNYDALIDQPCS